MSVTHGKERTSLWNHVKEMAPQVQALAVWASWLEFDPWCPQEKLDVVFGFLGTMVKLFWLSQIWVHLSPATSILLHKFDLNNIKVAYLECMGSKDGTTSAFTPKKGPLVLSPKTVGDDFAKTIVDWKDLYHSLRRASSRYERNPWSRCTMTFLSEGFVERQTLLFWWFLFILSCWIPIPFVLHSYIYPTDSFMQYRSYIWRSHSVS